MLFAFTQICDTLGIAAFLVFGISGGWLQGIPPPAPIRAF